ncbi:hypothetical protein TNCV_2651531 [Trichonephila clavipes]|nr:hypothetical protein TNCV_2651531 [Trichonephila clavipes]
MASAVLADPTPVLQGTNRGSGPAMEGSKNDVGSLEQLLLVVSACLLTSQSKATWDIDDGPRNFQPRSRDGLELRAAVAKLFDLMDQ